MGGISAAYITVIRHQPAGKLSSGCCPPSAKKPTEAVPCAEPPCSGANVIQIRSIVLCVTMIHIPCIVSHDRETSAAESFYKNSGKRTDPPKTEYRILTFRMAILYHRNFHKSTIFPNFFDFFSNYFSISDTPRAPKSSSERAIAGVYVKRSTDLAVNRFPLCVYRFTPF